MPLFFLSASFSFYFSLPSSLARYEPERLQTYPLQLLNCIESNQTWTSISIETNVYSPGFLGFSSCFYYLFMLKTRRLSNIKREDHTSLEKTQTQNDYSQPNSTGRGKESEKCEFFNVCNHLWMDGWSETETRIIW